MAQRKKPLAATDEDLNAHEKLFAERTAAKLLALVNDEAAGGSQSLRPQAMAAALQIALAGVECES